MKSSSSSVSDLFNQETINNKNETSIIVLTQASLVDLFHSNTPLTTSDGCVVTSVLRNTKHDNENNTTNNKSIICSTNTMLGGDGGRATTTTLTPQLVMFNHPTNSNLNLNFVEGNNTALSASNSSNMVTASPSTTTTTIALDNAGHSGQKSIIMALNSSQQVSQQFLSASAA